MEPGYWEDVKYRYQIIMKARNGDPEMLELARELKDIPDALIRDMFPERVEGEAYVSLKRVVNGEDIEKVFDPPHRVIIV
jgi:hypothetical protein